MCLRWLPRSEFSLEHAPQWANQSRLGPPWLLVSTCRPCNSRVAGAKFESAAAIVRKADDAAGRDPMCRAHGTGHGERVFNAGWMSSHEPVTLADLKSAYLIAFAVLGYSWATSARLAPLRRAIAGGRSAGPADALETCGLVTDASASRTVSEVSAPLPMVLVVSPEAELVIALPLAGTHDVTAACLSCRWAERDPPSVSVAAHGARNRALNRGDRIHEAGGRVGRRPHVPCRPVRQAACRDHQSEPFEYAGSEPPVPGRGSVTLHRPIASAEFPFQSPAER